jgi:cation diffusion facilitator CzcD-associated flavoprotein CzcO
MPDTNRSESAAARSHSVPKKLDVVVVGAGVSGLYALHKIREAGLSVRAFDEGGDIGGTWWWTRYPGARVDFPGGPFYCYTFSEEFVREFDWPETQPDQATVLRYMNFVADKLGLRRDVQLNTRVSRVEWDAGAQRWNVETNHGERFIAQFVVCGTGPLSARNNPAIPGLESFAGECIHTGTWPQEKTALEGKRIGVIGTGSSAVQAIPLLAADAKHLTVFQRTPQYVIPAGNRPLDPEVERHARENWSAIRAQMLESIVGSPFPASSKSIFEDTEEQRREVFEKRWQMGGQGIVFYTYGDLVIDKAANKLLAEFVRNKIREIVRSPDVAKSLLPDYDIACKRLVLGTDYYETFNRDNVKLVDLRDNPIESITPTSVRTRHGEHPIDILVLATGYDAISGSLARLNPRGRNGLALADKWSNRISTYLGMSIHGFPNLFFLNGPQSPGVLWNMPMAAELETQWIVDCIAYMRKHQIGTVEPSADAEEAWGEEVHSIADKTLFPKTDSWFTGANIPGKPKQFLVHLNGPEYFKRLTRVASEKYSGFVLEPQRAENIAEIY